MMKTTQMMMMMVASLFTNLLIIVYCCILFRGINTMVRAVTIENVSPLQAIENATIDVILDCQFTFDPNTDKHLVLKWFHNADLQPIYQWIPSLGKRDFSPKIEPYVDKSYVVDDKITPYRAIRLKSPTTYLNGQYTCSVSSIHSQEIAKTRVVIYAPARQFDITINPIDGGINVSCSAHGLYPSPLLTLHRYASNNDSQLITRDTKTITQGQSGQYSITLISIINDTSSSSDVAIHYECVLTIADTEYSAKRSVAVQSGWHMRRSPNSSCKVSIHLYSALIVVSLFLPLSARFCIIC